jgi:hypothetical protein
MGRGAFGHQAIEMGVAAREAAVRVAERDQRIVAVANRTFAELASKLLALAAGVWLVEGEVRVPHALAIANPDDDPEVEH